MVSRNGRASSAEGKAKDTPPTVHEILRGSAHALTVFKPAAADRLT